MAAPLLVASVLLPQGERALVALAFIIVLGVPHGALDGEIARDGLRPRYGRWWFSVFAAPYLLLSAGVFVAWAAAPLATLAGFLLVSVWHFGAEEREGADALEVVARGGLPIAVPTLAHPGATAGVFSVVTGTTMTTPPSWLTAAAVTWAGLALVWVGRTAWQRAGGSLLRPAAMTAAFVLLPPLTAFAIYFVGIHAPAHTKALIADRQLASRVRDARSAAWRAVPLTLLTIAIGAALWPLYPGPAPDRLLALTLQGLAALTLPHLVLEIIARRVAGRVGASRPA